MAQISAKLARKLLGEPKSKFNNRRVPCLYKHMHDSIKEAEWCVRLNQDQKEGKIRGLSREPVYDLRVNGQLVCTHLPDFDYEKLYGSEWRAEVLDAKGLKLADWSIKHKLFCALYPQIKYVVV